MRSGQAPLKLECFAVKSNDSKEKLGYLLLSLRTAHVFSRNRINNVKSNWHKLLGLKSELKIHKPELLLALSVHDQDASMPNSQLEVNCSLYDEYIFLAIQINKYLSRKNCIPYDIAVEKFGRISRNRCSAK